MKSAMAFDLYGGGSPASNEFVDYVNDMPSGTTVMIMTSKYICIKCWIMDA